MSKSGMVFQVPELCKYVLWLYATLDLADSSTSLKCLTAGCSVSYRFVGYTNDKAIPVAKFTAPCKFYFICSIEVLPVLIL